MIRKCLFTLFFLSSVLFASAHALWIETGVKGAKGKSHNVKIFFGEYAENERDTVSKWFSNLKEVQVFVTAPDGSKKQLTLTDAVNHYSSSFTPDQQGTYIVSLAHTVADVYGTNKLEYYATATVLVGGVDNKGLRNATTLALQPANDEIAGKKEAVVEVYKNSQALANAKVEVASPDGWVKAVHANTNGQASFIPFSSGMHMLEVIHSDKTASGTHNGKNFQSVTHIVTHCVYVK